VSSHLRQYTGNTYGWMCRYCYKQLHRGGGHLEHVIPQSKSSEWAQDAWMLQEFDNFVLACPPCNSSKGARDPVEWWLALPQWRRDELPGLSSFLVEMVSDRPHEWLPELWVRVNVGPMCRTDAQHYLGAKVEDPEDALCG
jgi:hypothetical protein